MELANFQATQDADSFYAVQAMAVESQWNIVDSRALQWVDKQMRQKNPYMGADPRIQLPLAAQKVRQILASKERLTEQPIWVDLMQSTSLAGWSQIGKQEIEGLQGIPQVAR